jgi:hypothetical protein
MSVFSGSSKAKEVNNKREADKKKKLMTLEGYKEEVFDNSQTDYAKYMFKPEERCTFLRTGKNFED